MNTFMAKKEAVEHKWLKVDATDQVLGRLATRIATVLQGKHRPTYTPHVDTGDFVVVVNAEKVRLTGNKLEQKEYHRYTGYSGGLRTTKVSELLDKHPERVLQLAVRRMLPKSKLGRAMFRKLKVFGGPDHPHEAQQPEEMSL